MDPDSKESASVNVPDILIVFCLQQKLRMENAIVSTLCFLSTDKITNSINLKPQILDVR